MEKVSIIIPVYNVEQFLDACIESVVNQTYRNLEIIAVDDGSTDNSGKILDDWAKKDSRIKVIHKENAGLSSARNAALNAVKGDYIAMIDSDDFWDDDAIEHMVTLAKDNQADMVIAGGRRVDLEGKIVPDKRPDVIDHEGVISEREFWTRRLQNMHYIVVWSKLYRKEIFDDIRFPEGEINEDVAVLWKIVSKCGTIYSSNKKIYNWRVNPDSITKSQFDTRNLYLAEALLEEQEYIKNTDLPDKVKYLTMYNAFIYTVDILAKAHKYLKDSKQIYEAEQIYVKYLPVAKELGEKAQFGDKKPIVTKLQMKLFCISKHGYILLRRIIRKKDE